MAFPVWPVFFLIVYSIFVNLIATFFLRNRRLKPLITLYSIITTVKTAGQGAKRRPVCQAPGFLVTSRQGPAGKEVPSRAFLWDLLAGIIAGLVVHWIVRRFL